MKHHSKHFFQLTHFCQDLKMRNMGNTSKNTKCANSSFKTFNGPREEYLDKEKYIKTP